MFNHLPWLWLAIGSIHFASPVSPARRLLSLCVHHSTQNSALFEHILQFPATDRKSSARVAVGTGQAIKNAANGDGDVLFVPCQTRLKEKVCGRRDGSQPQRCKYNDFIIGVPLYRLVWPAMTTSPQR